MNKFRFLTAGESHGKCLTAIIEGIPAGFKIDTDFINSELKRRQGGYGRGERMKIESDTVEITSGVRFGKTLGSPVTLVIQNKDFENWQKIMSTNPEDFTDEKSFSKYRPGHADYAGSVKYNQTDFSFRKIRDRICNLLGNSPDYYHLSACCGKRSAGNDRKRKLFQTGYLSFDSGHRKFRQNV